MGAILVLLAVAAAAWVLAPLRRPAANAGAGVLSERAGAPRAMRRGAADQALRDLEFDHAMGKVSVEDYDALRAGYEAAIAADGDISGGPA
ncbi:MAG TPA: hypothetical protein VJT32_12845 [bacterium]|nr:hypothetical protein [bacterium]